MDDLISRSALKQEIESLRMTITGLRAGKGILQKIMNEYRDSVLRIIDEQPTAYNVDKVVEEIKNLIYADNREAYCKEMTELGKCRKFDTCEECLLRRVISFANEEKYNACIDEILGGGE
ncbi:MAG: hypothetical protein IJ439_03685 [Tyzzerella sp.]|nr:hypothetical protein [Tyzzerella sp.]